MKPLISVIVPVYNTARYLPACLDSILAQSYANLEIILVDDGSSDGSDALCDALACEDGRIRVLHQAYAGVSAARNAGLELARGEYLLFVDSDDTIAPTMAEHLLAAAEKTGAKLAVANLKCVNAAGERVFPAGDSPIREEICTPEQLLPKLYEGLGWYYIVVWNKLYHRSLFDTLRFPVGKVYEDEAIIAQVVCAAEKIACISSEEYCYLYQRSGSITAHREGGKQCLWLEALSQRFHFCARAGYADFAAQTRGVYFRELNNLFLTPELKGTTTPAQRREAKARYAAMGGKTATEKINWLLFHISPRLERTVVMLVRKFR